LGYLQLVRLIAETLGKLAPQMVIFRSEIPRLTPQEPLYRDQRVDDWQRSNTEQTPSKHGVIGEISENKA